MATVKQNISRLEAAGATDIKVDSKGRVTGWLPEDKVGDFLNQTPRSRVVSTDRPVPAPMGKGESMRRMSAITAPAPAPLADVRDGPAFRFWKR